MTSLARQLQSLAVQGVTFDSELTKRPSFLFDSQKAASLDRDEAHAIGMNGFEGLCSVDKMFEESSSLFGESAKNTERSMLTKKENAELDLTIGKFLRRASPYFLHRFTHKCIEWLVYRFRIHYFSPETLLFAFLPYHTSKLYSRLLQLFDKSFLEKKWPILNKDIVPSKSIVLEQCLLDRSFFANICENLSKSLKECDPMSPNTAGILRPAVNLFTIYALEMVQNLKKNMNEFLATLMPYIVLGVKSKISDYKAASYMVITLLSSKMTFTEEVVASLIDLLANDYKLSTLPNECLSAIINLCQAQENVKSLSDKIIHNLIESEKFFSQLLTFGRFDIENFLMLVMSKLIPMHTSIEDMCDPELLIKITREFHLSESGQKLLVTNLLESLSTQGSDDKLLNVLLAMHRKYPTAVMNVVNNSGLVTSSDRMEKIVNALMITAKEEKFADCSFLSFSLNFESDEETSRSSAVVTLIQMLKSHPEISKSDFVRESVKCRLRDETSPVVAALWLELVSNHPDTLFQDLESASDALICLVLKNKGKIEWNDVSEAALEILISDRFASCPDEITDSVSFLLQDMIFYQACIQEKDIIGSLNSNNSFLKKNNWVLTENWKKGPASIISEVSNTFSDNPDLFFKLRRGSQRISRLLTSSNIELKMPYQYLVNFAFLKSVLTKKLNKSDNPKLNVAVVSIIKELVIELQSLLLQSVDRNTDGICDSEKDDNFSECLLTLSSQIHNGDGSLKITSKITLLFKFLEESYLDLKSISTDLKSCYEEWKVIAVALDNFKAMYEINNNALYLIVKQGMCDFFVEALPFVNERVAKDIRIKFQCNMRRFFEACFHSAEDVAQFLVKYWCFITTDDEAQENIGVSALQITNAVIGGKKKLNREVLLSAESPFVPTLLGVLNQTRGTLRKCAVECLSVLCSAKATGEYLELVKFVNENAGVILDDPNMIDNVLKQFFLLKSKTATKQKKVVRNPLKDFLLHHITVDFAPMEVKSSLLQVLRQTNSMELTVAIMPELSTLLDKCGEDRVLQNSEAAFTKEALCRIDPRNLIDSDVKTVFWKALNSDTPVSALAGIQTSPQSICLALISKNFFGDLEDSMKKDVIHKLVNIATSGKGSVDAIGKIFKSISLDATHVKYELENLVMAETEEPAKKKPRLSEDSIIDADKETDSWKKIVLLLEFLQEKKKITDAEVLLPSLFQLLEITLDDGKSSLISENVEYLRQLILTLVLHLVRRLHKLLDGTQKINEVIANACKIELLVHCVRCSVSTQTQHHALLLLSELAGYFPEKVLHNVMSIFTFMGSHLLRQDDSYSLQVISKTMRVVIPALTKADTKTLRNKDEAVLRILQAFVDSLPHIPSHRKIMVIHELLDTIGGPKYLWIIVVLLADLYVKRPVQNGIGHGVSNESPSAVLSFDDMAKICCDVCEGETLSVQISNIAKSMDYILTLPFNVQRVTSGRGTSTLNVVELNNWSTPQLRKFYMAVLSLILNVIEQNQESLLQTLKKSCSDDAMDDDSLLVPLLQCLYERVLQLISKITTQKEEDQDFGKFSKALITKCYGILRSVNSVLPLEISLGIFDVLLNKDEVFIKCKAMELLTEQLSARNDTLDGQQVCSVAKIGEDVSTLVLDTVKKDTAASQDESILCFTALASLKTAVRNFGKVKPEAFVKCMDNLCNVVAHLSSFDDIQVSTAVFLCLAEMCSCLKAYCIPFLNKFVPSLLSTVCQSKTFDHETLLFACVTLIHRILENLLDFCSMYLEKIVDKITALLLLEKYSSQSELDSDGDTLSSRISMRLKVIVNIIGTKVPSRIVMTVFMNLLNSDGDKGVSRIEPLCVLILKHVESLKRDDVTRSLSPISLLLYKLLEFHPQSTSSVDPLKIEDLATDITVTTILKLPENPFRSFFFGLSDWASTEERDDRLPVYYQLMLKLSKKMKGLFSLFCGIVVENAVGVLKRNNINHNLLRLICATLKSIFCNDNSNILTKERFEMMLQPLIDQFENITDSNETSNLVDVVRDELIPLLGEIASSVADDTCQKLLNYKILLKSRHSLAAVRHLSLKAVEEVGKRMAAEYSMLLPESIPFLAELMEDDDDEVEAECHAVIRTLEKAVGEPLQKYFNE